PVIWREPTIRRDDRRAGLALGEYLGNTGKRLPVGAFRRFTRRRFTWRDALHCRRERRHGFDRRRLFRTDGGRRLDRRGLNGAVRRGGGNAVGRRLIGRQSLANRRQRYQPDRNMPDRSSDHASPPSMPAIAATIAVPCG